MRARFVALLAVSTVSVLVSGCNDNGAAAERLAVLSKLFAGYNPTTFEWKPERAAAAGPASKVSSSEISLAYSGLETSKVNIAQTEDCKFSVKYFATGKTEPETAITVDFKKLRTASANIYTVGSNSVLVPGRDAFTSKKASSDTAYTFDDLIITVNAQEAQNQLALVKEFGEKHCQSKIEDTEPKLTAVGKVFADFSGHTLVTGDAPYTAAGRSLSELYLMRNGTTQQATKILEVAPCKFSIIEVMLDNHHAETEIDFNKLNMNAVTVRDGTSRENAYGKRRVITVQGKGANRSVKSFNPGLYNDLVLIVPERVEPVMIARLKEVQKFCKGV